MSSHLSDRILLIYRPEWEFAVRFGQGNSCGAFSFFATCAKVAEENVFAFALEFHDLTFVTVGLVVVPTNFRTVLLVALDWAMNLFPCLLNVPKRFGSKKGEGFRRKRGHISGYVNINAVTKEGRV